MNLKEKAISGTKWISISTIIVGVVQMLRLMILARFLDAGEFGVVAIITFVLGLTFTFSDVGFSAAIMHKKNVDEKDFSSLFWLQFLIFAVIYILLFSLSPFIASFYNEQILSLLIPIALLDLIFAGIGRLYDTVLQKTMQFKKIAIRNITSALCSLIVAIVLAINGFGIYSLIISTLSQTLINQLWNFIAGQQQYKIRFFCSIQRVIPYFKIGVFQTGTQIIDYFASRFDILIVGKLLGTEILGIYSLAKELLLRLILMVNSIANRVALPILSHNNEDNETLRIHYCKMINLLSFVNIPLNVFLGVLSYQVVILFYGESFVAVAPLLSILSIYGIMHSIGNPVGSLAIAKGRTDVSFRYTIVRAVISLSIISITALYTINVVAWGQIALMLVMFFVAWRMLIYKLIELPLLDYVKSFSPMLLISLVIGLISYPIVYYNIFNISNVAAQLMLYGVFIFLLFAFLIYVFLRKNIENSIVRKE